MKEKITAYYEKHPILMILLAPIGGIVFAVFLPFIGIAGVVYMIGRKLVLGLVHETSKVAIFTYRPAESYLTGKKARKEEKK